MEWGIYNITDLNNRTINVLNCLNNSLIYGINNTSCENAFNASLPNVIEKPKLTLSTEVLYGLCFVIIVVNSIVVISSGLIIRSNRNPSNAFILLGNVSLADVIMGLTITVGLSVPQDYISLLTCMFQIGGPIASTMASLYSVGLIAVDRYLYIVHGIYYQRWMNRTRVRLMISAIWIFSLIMGFHPALGWTSETMRDEQCWYLRITPPSMICASAVVSLIPVATACILYVIILIKAIRTVDKIQESIEVPTSKKSNETKLRIFRGQYQRRDTNNSNITASTSDVRDNNVATGSTDTIIEGKKNYLRKPWYKCNAKGKKSKPSDLSKWKAVKIVMLTTSSMVVTWVPYIVATLTYVTCDKKTSADLCTKLEAAISSPLAILGVFNSILNPIIYAWLHKDFKRSAKKIIMKIFNMRQATKNVSRSTNSRIGNVSHL